MKAPKPIALYVIKYYHGLILKETIGLDKPMTRGNARWKANQLRRTTHKTGILIPEPVNKQSNDISRS
jgi:hypothetical protein